MHSLTKKYLHLEMGVYYNGILFFKWLAPPLAG